MGSEKDNFQDKAETAEYKKGERAGSQGRRRGKRGGAGKYSDKGKGQKYAVDIGVVNDPNWNAPTKQLLKDSFSLPYAEPLGIDFNLGSPQIVKDLDNIPEKAAFGNKQVTVAVPSIMAIRFLPTVGEATEQVSPLNMGANSFYSYTIHLNSKRVTYEAPNLMQYIIAMDSALMWHATLVRLYGYITYYQWYNRDVPKYLVQAMGFDYDNLWTRLAELRVLINTYAYKLQALYVPQGFDFMTRHQWIVRDVYADSQDAKAQLYLFAPAGLYRWKEGTGSPEDNRLTYLRFDDFVKSSADYGKTWMNEPLISFNGIAAMTEELLGPILTSQDFNQMSGDLLKAFGAGNAIKVGAISETYALKPVYSQEILMEIENANIITERWTDYDFEAIVYENTDFNKGYLESTFKLRPKFNATKPFYYVDAESDFFPVPSSASDFKAFATNHPTAKLVSSVFGFGNDAIINMHKADPTPEDTSVAVNFKVAGFPVDYAQPVGEAWTKLSYPEWIPLSGYGTEILVGAKIMKYYGNKSMDFCTHPIIPLQIIPVSGRRGENIAGHFELYSRLNSLVSSFDWFPFYQPIMFGDGTMSEEPRNKNSVNVALHYLGDFDNYTVLPNKLLREMHRTATLSKFTCSKISPNFDLRSSV